MLITGSLNTGPYALIPTLSTNIRYFIYVRFKNVKPFVVQTKLTVISQLFRSTMGTLYTYPITNNKVIHHSP